MERLRVALTGLVILLAVILVAERLGYAGVYAGQATGRALAIQAALAAPSILYLYALWHLRVMGKQIAARAPFAAAVGHGLRWAGRLLIAGAALALIAPHILSIAIGMAEPKRIDLDLSTLVIGAIGAALMLIAGLIDRARDVQAELDEIF